MSDEKKKCPETEHEFIKVEQFLNGNFRSGRRCLRCPEIIWDEGQSES